jgi:FixJ family two-component response regulator
MNDLTEIIFIIDDEESVRSSISLFLESDDFTVESFSSSEEFLSREPWPGAGCLILDVNLAGKSGLDLQEEMVVMNSHLPIIFITGQGNIPMSVTTLKKGAINFLEKPFKHEKLLQSISEALSLSRKLKSEKQETLKAIQLIETLSARELEILKNMMSGMLNKQIAHKLNIAIQTVKHHRLSISEKLHVKSVPEISRIAEKAGIIPHKINPD